MAKVRTRVLFEIDFNKLKLGVDRRRIEKDRRRYAVRIRGPGKTDILDPAPSTLCNRRYALSLARSPLFPLLVPCTCTRARMCWCLKGQVEGNGVAWLDSGLLPAQEPTYFGVKNPGTTTKAPPILSRPCSMHENAPLTLAMSYTEWGDHIRTKFLRATCSS